MKIRTGIFVLMLFALSTVATGVYAQGVSVTVVDYPRQVESNDYFRPIWTVDAGTMKVEESGIVWGTAPGGASAEAYPFKSVGGGNGDIYTTSIKAVPDMNLFNPEEVVWIYFRAYAVVGGKPYFSDEARSLYVYNSTTHRSPILP